MALYLTPKRIASLRELAAAGPRGVARLLSKEGDVLEQHGLAEGFTDPSRILTERLRLTWMGRAFEPVYRSREERR